jgi:hypothetical protein
MRATGYGFLLWMMITDKKFSVTPMIVGKEAPDVVALD